MNATKLNNTVNNFGYSGNILSKEEAVMLQNSLLILQNDNHFRNIYLWGKIMGIENDYYLAFGYVDDAVLGRVFFYSRNGYNWGLLPRANSNAKLLTPLCVTRFQGDPALVVDVFQQHATTEPFGTEIFKKDGILIKKLKEEDRLAATVQAINKEALIVPRGGLFKRPDGKIIRNPAFAGLTLQDAKEFNSYIHWRFPQFKWNTNMLTKSDFNYETDFLDPIDKDIPKGSWSLQIHRGGTIAILRSLYWQGMTLYHEIGTPEYGSLYFGHGRKNLDVPHMLHNWE